MTGVSAKLTVSCPACGEVKVWATEMAMLLYPDDSGHFTFRCPGCREVIARRATLAQVGLLRSVHVAESRIRPHRDTSSPPLTEDDLIEFGKAIEGEDDPWSELGTTSSSPRS